MKEVERRFLVTQLPNDIMEKYKAKHIVQHYLYADTVTAIRKRMIETQDTVSYIYTVKTKGNDDIGVEEIEHTITENEYNELAITPAYTVIDKTRYIIPIENNLKIELDVFHGPYEGIIFAEIEFPNEESAKKFKPENFKWFGKELTNKITNSMMASSNKPKKIIKLIKEC